MHLQKNAQHHITKTSKKAEVASDIRAIFNAPWLPEAERLLKIFIEKYSKDMPGLANWAEENLPQGFTVFSLPEALRRKLRTNNLEERMTALEEFRTRIITDEARDVFEFRIAIVIRISLKIFPHTILIL